MVMFGALSVVYLFLVVIPLLLLFLCVVVHLALCVTRCQLVGSLAPCEPTLLTEDLVQAVMSIDLLQDLTAAHFYNFSALVDFCVCGSVQKWN